MITADQILLHLLGDYLLQSDWMANGKRRSFSIATWHALAYSFPFLLLRPSPVAIAFIFGTHLLIDWLGLARYVVFAKNFLAPPAHWPKWANSWKTGYDHMRPEWLAVWLTIIADNTLHLVCNGIALKYL